MCVIDKYAILTFLILEFVIYLTVEKNYCCFIRLRTFDDFTSAQSCLKII